MRFQRQDLIKLPSGDEGSYLSSMISSPFSDPLPPKYLKYTTLALTTLSALSSSKPKALYNPHEGHASGRQLDEPVASFLDRLPPLTTLISSIGPWIWIANPYSAVRPTGQDIAGLMAEGEAILSNFEGQRDQIEASMANKAKATITRKVNAIREKTRIALLDLARKKGCTIGKWMLFPMEDDVNRVWGLVAKATCDGTLGVDAKVATDQGKGPTVPRLICVYTRDFGDKKDLKRVLTKLGELGLLGEKGQWGQDRLLYYKPGKWTMPGQAE